MPELREVFEMTTKQVEPDVDAWREQEGRQRRSTRNRKIGAYVASAAIGIVAVAAVIIGARGTRDTTTPAGEPSTVIPVSPEPISVGPAPLEVAKGFVEAYGALDVDRAITYLAQDADISGLVGGTATLKDFRLDDAWSEATGFQLMLDSCEEVGSSASGTNVRCTFDWQGLRSDEIGLGPYSGGSFDLTVRDGAIVRASVGVDTTEFSPQVWEPFAGWVSATYPEDAAVMYQDASYSNYRLTRESIRLWKLHTREYVKEMTAS